MLGNSAFSSLVSISSLNALPVDALVSISGNYFSSDL